METKVVSASASISDGEFEVVQEGKRGVRDTISSFFIAPGDRAPVRPACASFTRSHVNHVGRVLHDSDVCDTACHTSSRPGRCCQSSVANDLFCDVDVVVNKIDTEASDSLTARVVNNSGCELAIAAAGRCRAREPVLVVAGRDTRCTADSQFFLFRFFHGRVCRLCQ